MQAGASLGTLDELDICPRGSHERERRRAA
jgi:hypothetical protein